MTLVAGFKCRDGFVVAADTEMTFDSILFQGHKLSNYSGESRHYEVVIGGAGDGDYIAMVSQNIRDAIAHTPNPTFTSIKAIIQDKILSLHDDHIFKNWDPGDQYRPYISLIAGIEGEGKEFGVVASDRTSVAEVEHYDFRGSGSVLAHHIAEKMIVPCISTASMVHLANQLFKEVKGKGAGVGGNTELIGRRCNPDAEPFFNISIDDNRFVWGLESALLSAVRCAVDRRKPDSAVSKRLKFISQRLKEIRKKSGSSQFNAAGETLHLTQLDTEYGNIFRDID